MLKTIPNFPDYAITKDGQVWSKRYYKWLKHGHHIKMDYLFVIFCVKRKKKNRLIHQLVLETYVGKCPPEMECRHLDGNPANNRLENLCWDTRSNNQKDRIKHSTCNMNLKKYSGEKHYLAKFVEQDIRRIIYMYKTGLFTQTEIAEIYNVHQTTIQRIVNKKTWHHI